MATSYVSAFDWREISPKLDPRSRVLYLILVALVPITWLMLWSTGLRLVSWPWLLPALSLFAIFTAMMLRRAGRERSSTALETIALMVSQGTAIAILQLPLIAVGFPLSDDLLLRADTALGFDWLAFARLFNEPAAYRLIFEAYASMKWQALIILLLLCATGRTDRAWQLVSASLIALCITAAIFVFVPADGRYVLCGQSEIPIPEGYCDYVAVLRDVHSGTVTQIDRTMRLGMVSFPSFHTAAAVLLTWAAWELKWLRWPFVALNLAMLAGTIVVGAHYFVDVIGGAVIAAGSIFAGRWAVSSRLRPSDAVRRPGAGRVPNSR